MGLAGEAAAAVPLGLLTASSRAEQEGELVLCGTFASLAVA